MILQRIVLFLIRCYKCFSRCIIPSACRFQPTCSTYAYKAIEIHGVLKGSLLFFKRIIRCHPLCVGGVDPLFLYKYRFNTKREK
ncbi:MAG: membrane protein insertion efficiency factor YidD [Endomicrobium sp.]|nr:membrane protein insertion efficiency factor YidD [Endomicrobium sp.]